MADFEIIEDIKKTIPKGKDLKKMTPFIIGGLGLGVVALMFGKRNNDVPTNMIAETDGVGSNTDLGGLLNDFSNQTNQALQQNNQEMSYQLSEVAGNLFDIVGEQNALINQLQQEQNQLESDLKNQPTNVYQESTSVQSSNITRTPEADSGFSIYFDDVDDDIQYNNAVTNLRKAVSGGSISSSEATKIKKDIAGLGNNGVGWTESNYSDNRERLATNSDYVKSEIERADLVIENRKASGLSTKAQTEYKARLVSGKEWTQ